MINWQTFGLICVVIALGIVLNIPIKTIYFKFDNEKDLKNNKQD
jgi:hypothetical protein